MTFIEAAFYGMGLVLLFGLVALLLAYVSKPSEDKTGSQPHRHAH